MPIYDHRCSGCGPVLVETDTIFEYLEYEKKYGKSDGDSIRVPCPGCGGWAARDYAAGVASMTVKGGTLYKTEHYRRGAEENWLRDEVKNVKEILRFREGVRPYAGYTVDPADVGAKEVSPEHAKARADQARRTLGDTKAKVDHQSNKR